MRRVTVARLPWLLCALLAVPASGEERASAAAPAPLHASEAELQRDFGERLREVPVVRPPSIYEQIAGTGDHPTRAEPLPPHDPFAAQRRLALEGEGDVRRIELDLYQGRTYRVRWQLATRFERPLMAALVAHLGRHLGDPDYDQTLAAELGPGRSELRRTGWSRDGRILELRQLHPFTGGALFLSLGEQAVLQAIVDAGGTPLPQPERSGDWWRRAQPEPKLPTEREREALVAQVSALVDALLATPPPAS